MVYDSRSILGIVKVIMKYWKVNSAGDKLYSVVVGAMGHSTFCPSLFFNRRRFIEVRSGDCEGFSTATLETNLISFCV